MAADATGSWPPGNGEMARRIREHDWARTALGPVSGWPQSLKTSVENCLASGFAGYVWWGPALIELHNDAAVPILQAKHPAALGQPAAEIWADVWPVVGSLFERVLATGAPVTAQDLPMDLERGGPRETAYFTFCYSALRDESGLVAGMQAVAIEMTTDVRARERLRASEVRQTFLLQVHDALRALSDPIEVQRTAMRLIAERHGAFRALYFDVAPDGDRVTSTEGVDYGAVPIPRRFLISDFGSWIAEELGAGLTVCVEDVDTDPRIEAANRAAYNALGVRAAVAIPLVKGGRLVAAIAINHAEPHEWSPGELSLLQELAGRTWAAVERSRAEAALRTSEERYRTLFDSIDVGFCTMEVFFDQEDTAVDYRFLETNPAFLRQTGLAHAVGKTIREIVPNHEEFWFETFGRIARTGEAARFEHEAAALGRFYEVYAFRIGSPDQHRVAVLFNDIGPRKDAEAALRGSRASLQQRVTEATAELRTLSGRLLAVQEEERRRLALELHDDFGQVLTALGLLLGAPPNPTRAAEARAMVADLTERVRQRSMELRPAALDAYGLLPALHSLLERYERQGGIHVELTHEGLDRRFSPAVEVGAYRIVQEALTNVARHAGTDHAAVQLYADDVALTISIRDEGLGFDLETVVPGSGLGGMRERAQLLGGTFTVDAVPGIGVTAVADLPLGVLPAGKHQP